MLLVADNFLCVGFLDKRTGEDNKVFRDYGFGGINRPNRTTYTSLHLACLAGHLVSFM